MHQLFRNRIGPNKLQMRLEPVAKCAEPLTRMLHSPLLFPAGSGGLEVADPTAALAIHRSFPRKLTRGANRNSGSDINHQQPPQNVSRLPNPIPVAKEVV